jgi:hypothetical protein
MAGCPVANSKNTQLNLERTACGTPTYSNIPAVNVEKKRYPLVPGIQETPKKNGIPFI